MFSTTKNRVNEFMYRRAEKKHEKRVKCRLRSLYKTYKAAENQEGLYVGWTTWDAYDNFAEAC